MPSTSSPASRPSVRFEGVVYRIMVADRSHDPCAPAGHPEGRFHHHGQRAIYTSLTEEGAAVAIARYVAEGDPARVIVPLAITATRVWDRRGDPSVSIVWQARRTADPADTWFVSDAARRDGAQAMLYSSRSRPDLTHLVVFDTDPTCVSVAGDPRPWP